VQQQVAPFSFTAVSLFERNVGAAMTPTVSEIWKCLTEWAPSELAESWDNVGLQAGFPGASVSRVLVALDPTERVLAEAVSRRAQMVITHHPLLLRPLQSLDVSKNIPRLLAGFLRSDIALFAGHTNLDCAKGGVSDLLAEALVLSDIKPLLAAEKGRTEEGLGRIGRLPQRRMLSEIAAQISDLLSTPSLLLVGNPDATVETVALCGGSGSDLWPASVEAGADLYISSEIKHHIAREAEQTGKAIIDAGHFYTEWPIVPAITDFLRQESAKRNWGLEVSFFERERSPFDLWINSSVGRGGLVRGSRPFGFPTAPKNTA
jgi:dinuclear metal center YbgI/SA1388 family protein